jgi:DNA topoisomerase-1
MVQIGLAEDEEKPRFAGIPAGTKMDDLTIEVALKLFELPRVVGTTPEGEEITANNGRFGPYIKFGSLYVSIKPEDPYSITQTRALELIAIKKKAEAEKNIQIFEDSPIKVLNGRFGPYITDGTKNAKIPKDQDPAKLTLAECKKLLADAPAKTRRRFSRRATK